MNIIMTIYAYEKVKKGLIYSEDSVYLFLPTSDDHQKLDRSLTLDFKTVHRLFLGGPQSDIRSNERIRSNNSHN